MPSRYLINIFSRELAAKWAALVSLRDGPTNQNGSLISTLNTEIVALEDKIAALEDPDAYA